MVSKRPSIGSSVKNKKELGSPSQIFGPMYYIYTIQSKKNKIIYVGYTSDLRKRLNLHNSGKIFSTKPYKPFILIYYEAYQNKDDALEREKFLKSGWGKSYIKRVLKHYFQSKNLGGLAAKIQFRKRFERNHKLVYPPKFKEI